MARWTGTWLSALGGTTDRQPQGFWAGRRYGLPETGPGSVATAGSRFVALMVDLVAGMLIGGLVNVWVADPTSVQRTLAANGAFALQVVVLQALTSQSIGMRLLGIRVARVGEPQAVPGLLPVAVRTALLFLVVPALLLDRDGRGLHDKVARTVVLRAR